MAIAGGTQLQAAGTLSLARSRPRAWVTYLAGLWSLGYGALGLYWSLGGGGFPFGDTGAQDRMSLLGGLRPETGGPLIAGVGVAGAIAALAMARSPEHRLLRILLLGYAWSVSAVLLLVVPDSRILALLGYLPALIFDLGFELVDWPMLNQVICLAGGFTWAAAALTYSARRGDSDGNRVRNAAAAGAARGPWWGRWVTYAAVVLPLPYAATRLAWALGVPVGLSESSWMALAANDATTVELSLSGMAVAGALLTLGLVQPWGETFPGWIPILAGKRVPPAMAVVPASLASIVLTVGGFSLWRMAFANGIGEPADWGAIPPALAFLPWGVTLGLATLAYARRRGL